MLAYSLFSLILTIIMAWHLLTFRNNDIYTVFEWIINLIVLSFVIFKMIGMAFSKSKIEELITGIENLAESGKPL